ncbi:MAG TPA: DUF3037 domain-containing protein [Myxococcaceae bacterium]|nr:DUF3037 domain-containing protein [Myxococcaceae bacterium]
MPERVSYDYAVIRVVPSVERGELINAGAVVFCAVRDWLEAKVELNEARLLALAPDADVEDIRRHLEAIPRICAGGEGAGPIGALARKERWHWLVAPRSTVIQPGPVHTGLCESPGAALEQILKEMVR